MKDFVYVGHATRVVFGVGAVSHVRREIESLGVRKALVICGTQQREEARKVAELLGSYAVGLFDRSAMHVPIEIAREAQALARELGAECAVAIGGGSTIGLGKAIALDSGLPIVAIPTTYAGSEMTPIYGITELGSKRTGKDPRVLPRTVIYDPTLSLTLPRHTTITSAMNAMAHATEGLYARDGNPITDLMAEEGLRVMSRALPKLHVNVEDLAARSDALYGAWLCGTVLGHVGMALHHKLCHTLGGSFDLPHADVHTVMLPHSIAYNAPAIPEAMNKMRRALNCDEPASTLFNLARGIGAPSSLRTLGMHAEDLERAADMAISNPYWNPRALERIEILRLLQRAWNGDPP